MREIGIGDYVLSYDLETGIAKPSRVTQKWDNGSLDCYRVTFSDGASVEAAGSHPFPVKMKSGAKYVAGNGSCQKVKIFRKTINELLPRVNNSVSNRTRMLSPTSVEYLPVASLPLHPYWLGVMLGDGSFSSLQCHCQNDSVNHRAIANSGMEHQVYVTKDGKKTIQFHDNNPNGPDGRYRQGDAKQALEKLGLLNTKIHSKFIPDAYLSASIEDRKQLLAGLIDTDGFLYGFTVKSKRLAEGFQVLVRSLGGKATLQEVQKSCTNAPGGPKIGTYYNVTWRAYDIPCELTYKLPARTKRNCDYSSRIIRTIDPIGKRHCYCIEIDHPDHCFLIGDFVATCNSENGAYEAVLAVTGQHPMRTFPDQGIGWIVGLDNAMIRDVDRPLFEKYLPSRFKTKFYKQDNIWICNGDGREWKVVFKSTEMGPDKFQAANIDFAWIDEEPKKTEIFSELEARLIDRAGIWWMTATPVRGTAWLKELSDRPGVFKTFAGMRENPYLPLDEVEAYAATLDEDERDVRIEGKYVIFGGRPVFKRRLLADHLEHAEAVVAEQGALICT